MIRLLLIHILHVISLLSQQSNRVSSIYHLEMFFVFVVRGLTLFSFSISRLGKIHRKLLVLFLSRFYQQKSLN